MSSPTAAEQQAESRERALALVSSTPDRFDWTNREQLELLRDQINPDLSDQQFMLFCQVAKHTNLDPFRRQIYGTVRNGKLVIQTGIDGYRAIAARTGLHAGTDDAVFNGRSQDKQYPGEATVTVYKLVGGVRVPYTATARWDEYKPDQDWMWKRMPHNQLGKCAEALALRKAFPEETAGIDAEEATVNVDAASVTVEPQPHEVGREEALRLRFGALPVAAKVQYTAWVESQDDIPQPGHREDPHLDRLEWAMELVEVHGLVPRCSQCEAYAVKDGLCVEHQLPPEVTDPDVAGAE